MVILILIILILNILNRNIMATTDSQMAMVVIKEKPEAPKWFSEQQKKRI